MLQRFMQQIAGSLPLLFFISWIYSWSIAGCFAVFHRRGPASIVHAQNSRSARLAAHGCSQKQMATLAPKDSPRAPARARTAAARNGRQPTTDERAGLKFTSDSDTFATRNFNRGSESTDTFANLNRGLDPPIPAPRPPRSDERARATRNQPAAPTRPSRVGTPAILGKLDKS